MRIIVLDDEIGIIDIDVECDDAELLLHALEEGQISKVDLVMLLGGLPFSRNDDFAALKRIDASMIRVESESFSEKRSFERPKKKIMPPKNTNYRFGKNHWPNRRK